MTGRDEFRTSKAREVIEPKELSMKPASKTRIKASKLKKVEKHFSMVAKSRSEDRSLAQAYLALIDRPLLLGVKVKATKTSKKSVSSEG